MRKYNTQNSLLSSKLFLKNWKLPREQIASTVQVIWTQELYRPWSLALLYPPQTTRDTKASGGSKGLCLKPSPHHHHSICYFLPSHLTLRPSVDCWQLEVSKMSHAENSSNPNSLLLISFTSLWALQELCFHLWLLQTPDSRFYRDSKEPTLLLSVLCPLPP